MFFSIGLLLISMISIQAGSSFAKSLFPLIGTEGTTFLRQTFAAVFLCLVWRPWRHKLTRKDFAWVSIYGLSLSGMNLFFYMSLARIPLGLAVAIEFLGPLALSIFSSKKKLDLLWASIALIGIILILPLTEFSKPIDLLGVLYVSIAGAFWSLYILFGKKAGAKIPSGTAVTLGMIVAACITAPFGIMKAGPLLLNIKILPMALVVAIFSGALPYSLEMFALKKLPTSLFGILMSLEPVFAALSGLIFLNERLTHSQWLAIFCIISASIGSTLFRAKRAVESQTIAY